MISACDEITDKGVKAAASGCHDLQNVKLSCSKKISDDSVMALVSGCPKLQDIDLYGCPRIINESVKAILSFCPKLRDIGVSHLQNVIDKGVMALAFGCPELHSVSIESCHKISGKSVTALSLKCRDLKSFSFCTSKTSDDSLLALTNNSRQLQIVEFNFCNIISRSGVKYLQIGKIRSERDKLNYCRKMRDYVDLIPLPFKGGSRKQCTVYGLGSLSAIFMCLYVHGHDFILKSLQLLTSFLIFIVRD